MKWMIPISAQVTFQKTIGGTGADYGIKVLQATDGGFIVYSVSQDSTGEDWAYLTKTDAYGDTIWTRRYFSTPYYPQSSFEKTPDGGYVLAGISQGSTIYLVKTDSIGVPVFTRFIQGAVFEGGCAVQPTTDGGYILASSFINPVTLSADILLLKTDNNGDTLWARTYDILYDDFASSVRQISNGGFIVVGSSNAGASTNYDICVLRMDSAGFPHQTKTFSTAGFDYGVDVWETYDGGFLVSGYLGGQALLRMTYYLGNIWTNTYSGSSNNKYSSVIQTADSGIVMVSSSTNPFTLQDDIQLVKMNAAGLTLFVKAYGDSMLSEQGLSVDQTQDEGFIVCGTTFHSTGSPDVYLLKLDPIGGSGCFQNTVSPYPPQPLPMESTWGNFSYPISLIVGSATMDPGYGFPSATICLNAGADNYQFPERNFNLFPNPTSTQFSVSGIEEGTIEIYNVLGALVISAQDIHETTQNFIAPSKSGIYFVKAITAAGDLRQKLIVE